MQARPNRSQLKGCPRLTDFIFRRLSMLEATQSDRLYRVLKSDHNDRLECRYGIQKSSITSHRLIELHALGVLIRQHSSTIEQLFFTLLSAYQDMIPYRIYT